MNKIKKIIYKNLKKKEKLPYSNLSPKSNIEDKNDYFKALKWAIKDDKEIHNIAITGVYGSGKSSIITSFFRKNRKIKKLSVSMASFNGKKMNEEEIEKSILQQLFYKVKDRKIHYSRFKKIKNEKKTKTLLIIICTILLFLAIGYSGLKLFNPTEYGNIENYIKFVKYIYTEKELIRYTFIFIISILIVIYCFIRFAIEKIKLSKVKIKNVEMEIDKGRDESVFNKYLDEIIYFFEVTKYKVVVFEDLDRLDNKEIFIKLRELNNLLNNSEVIKRSIVFIYAVKDDVFSDSAERTKFFDFILPIIPFINSNNSKEILYKKLGCMEININSEFDRDFLENISIYINDMRILNNICNEFYIYRKNLLDSIELQKLFAMVVYKNLNPSEFEEIQHNKGYIHKIFLNKETIQKRLLININDEVKNIQEKKKDAEEETIESINELKKYIVGEFIQRDLIYSDRFVADGKTYNVNEIFNEEFDIDELINSTIKKYAYSNPYCEFNELLDGNILSRIENIKNKEESKINKLTKEINQKIEKKNKISEMKIKDLIKENTYDKVIDKNIYGESDDLTRYLIGNGYIDEEYEDYINYFHEGSLSTSDKTFIQKVNAQREIEYSYQIKNKENTIKIIEKTQFKYKSILNFDILDYLLNNKDFDDKKEVLIDNIIDETEKSKDFIVQYVHRNKTTDKFIKEICKKWNTIWKFIERNDDFTDRKAYLVMIFKYADINNLISINKETSLNTAINKFPDFISYFTSEKEITKLKEIFDKINIKLINISESCSKLEIFEYIKNGQYYEINDRIVKIILQNKMNNDYEKIDTQNYTCILNSKDKNLIENIEKNIEEYIKNVFFVLPNNTKEELDSIIKLVNNEQINDELKKQMLKKEEIIFDDITIIKNEYWPLLLSTNKINPTWNNVGKYYEQYKMDDELISYLNVNKNLFKGRINTENEEQNLLLSKDIVYNEKIDEKLIQNIKYIYKKLDFSNISMSRSEKILELGKAECTPENFNSLRENYKNMISILVKNKISNISKENEYEFDNEDIFIILNDEMIGLKQKVELIKNKEDVIECETKDEAEKIMYILQKTKSKYTPRFELLKGIFVHDLLIEDKIKLLTKYIDDLTEEECGKLFENMEYPYNEISQKNKNPYIETNEIILNKIKKFSYVSKIKEEKNGVRIYKKKE